jgi:excisionase family DNA binding protein
MLTVPEAARRVHRNPETVRRWIREGRLRARRIGTQHLIEEADLREVLAEGVLRLPAAWRRTFTGEPMPDIVSAIRSSRSGR